MKFTIIRTSGGGKPCKEATPYEVKHIEVRKLGTPEEFDKEFGIREGKWLEHGTNHRIIDGYIARDIDTIDCWAIEINSLEDLLELRKKYGDLIITTNLWDRETLEIEIYDDYRE